MKFPKSGAWIMITKTIPVEIPIDPLTCFYAKPSQFRMGSVSIRKVEAEYGDNADEKQRIDQAVDYWLSANMDSRDGHFVYAKGKRKEMRVEVFCDYAQIQTRWGAVLLRPDEFSILSSDTYDENGVIIGKGSFSERLEFVKDGHAFIRWYNDDQDANKMRSMKFRDGLFYLRSRGIPMGTAVSMLTGLISSQSIFYLEMHWRYQEMFTRNYGAYVSKKSAYLGLNPTANVDIMPGGGEAELAQYRITPELV